MVLGEARGRDEEKDDDETRGEAAPGCGFEEQLFRFLFKTITCCPTPAVLPFLKEGLNRGQNHLICEHKKYQHSVKIFTQYLNVCHVFPFLEGTDFQCRSRGAR